MTSLTVSLSRLLISFGHIRPYSTLAWLMDHNPICKTYSTLFDHIVQGSCPTLVWLHFSRIYQISCLIMFVYILPQPGLIDHIWPYSTITSVLLKSLSLNKRPLPVIVTSLTVSLSQFLISFGHIWPYSTLAWQMDHNPIRKTYSTLFDHIVQGSCPTLVWLHFSRIYQISCLIMFIYMLPQPGLINHIRPYSTMFYEIRCIWPCLTKF